MQNRTVLFFMLLIAASSTMHAAQSFLCFEALAAMEELASATEGAAETEPAGRRSVPLFMVNGMPTATNETRESTIRARLATHRDRVYLQHLDDLSKNLKLKQELAQYIAAGTVAAHESDSDVEDYNTPDDTLFKRHIAPHLAQRPEKKAAREAKDNKRNEE